MQQEKEICKWEFKLKNNIQGSSITSDIHLRIDCYNINGESFWCNLRQKEEERKNLAFVFSKKSN